MLWFHPSENFFSETCDARALPLVGRRSESVRKERSRGGVASGCNAACQSPKTWYILGQIVVTILLLLLNGRHLLADAAQSSSSGPLSTGRLVFEAAVLPVRRTVANRMLRLEYLRSSGSTKGGMRRGRSAASVRGVTDRKQQENELVQRG